MLSIPSIVSIGTSVPEHKISQPAFLDFMRSLYPENRLTALKMRKILLGSGIDTRHSVLGDFDIHTSLPVLFRNRKEKVEMPGIRERMREYEQHAFPLSLKAVDDAFNRVPWLRPPDITHVVTFSCTGMYAPGIDIQLTEALGIATSAERYNINFMGCYAAFNALKAAWHICRSVPDAKVLVSGVELCSIHFNNIDSDEQLVANSIFADGSAAALVTASANIPLGDHVSFQLETFHSEFASAAASQMLWNIGSQSFDLRLSPDVPASISSEISGQISSLLNKNGIKISDIDLFAIHPGGVKILQACEKGLGIDAGKNENSYSVLRDNGNMSSVTVLFVLKKFLESLGTDDSGKKILSCAFGPGLTTESLIASVI